MPSYSNRRPDIALLSVWIERDVGEWLDANVNKKGKGRFISVLLAKEIAKREERERVLAEIKPAEALAD
jgi:hypothetical protein